jgi:DNA polymerase I
VIDGVEKFEDIVFVDAEFNAPPGHRPEPVCLVMRFFPSGKVLKLWRDELETMTAPPFDVATTLVVAFFASAEIAVFRALGWCVPKYVVDMYVEFRERTNGVLPRDASRSLIGALHYFGLPAMKAKDKEAMRELIQRGNWSPEEKRAILEYCEADVIATMRLWSVMAPALDLERAILRGRYMGAVAEMEHRGIPVDTDLLEELKLHWEPIKERLVLQLDDFHLFDGTTFKADRLEQLLARKDWSWPGTPTGRLDLRSETFSEMANVYPELRRLHELRSALSKLRPNEIAVGADGRHRCLLSPFSTSSSRHAPSTSRFIFCAPAWARSLIKPRSGWGVVYLDWSQQEFGIAAALSGDKNMIHAYESGDPYLAFGKLAALIPEWGTKKTHPRERGLCKTCVLGVQYSMGAMALALRLQKPVAYATDLLSMHRRVFRRYWEWSQEVLDHAMLHGWIKTRLGWSVRVGLEPRPTSLTNFPMQANGAELLRLAIIGGLDAGLGALAPVHDALLMEAPSHLLDEHVLRMKEIMARVSRLYLDGLELRTDAAVVRFPDRYRDPERGEGMWTTVMGALTAARRSP